MTLGALAQAPLLPWRWKMDITHWWLKRYFYGPAGIVHMMPGGGKKAAPRENDYAGSVLAMQMLSPRQFDDAELLVLGLITCALIMTHSLLFKACCKLVHSITLLPHQFVSLLRGPGMARLSVAQQASVAECLSMAGCSGGAQEPGASLSISGLQNM